MPQQNMGATARRSERALLSIPIRIEGKDAFGKTFDETTYTQIVNRCGGQLVVTHALKADELIIVTNLRNNVSCPFRVVSRATKSLSGAPEWGVECLEPEAEIWGVRFPSRTGEPQVADLIHALLECQACHSREMAALNLQQYRRLLAKSSLPRPCLKCGDTKDWKFGFVEAELEDIPRSVADVTTFGSTPQDGAEKRRDKRLVVKVPLGVRLADGLEETATTENISKSGLCFASDLGIKVGDRVFVSVGPEAPEEQRNIPARVMWRRPAKDKGRAFYGVKLEGRE